MKKILLKITLAAFLLPVLFTNLAKASDLPFSIKLTKIPITPKDIQGSDVNYKLKGNYIAWERNWSITNASRSDDYYTELFVYNIQTKANSLISSISDSSCTAINTNFAIDGSNLYWDECVSDKGERDIYSYNLISKNKKALINDKGNQVLSSVSGNYILYADYGASAFPSQISLYNLTTGEKTIVPGLDEKEKFAQAMNGNTIAWEEYGSGSGFNVDIYAYDMAKKRQFPVVTQAKAQNLQAIADNYIIWTDARNNLFQDGCADADRTNTAYPHTLNSSIKCNNDIYAYNLATEKEIRITDNPYNQGFPTISNSKVVYNDTRNGNIDIYYYDLSTSKEYRLTNSASNQYNPYIEGNKILWTDDVSGKDETFFAELIYPAASTTSKPEASTPAPTPAKPVLSNITLTKTTAKKTTTLTSNSTGLRTNETLILSGTTSPNAKVTLTIQSNPITLDLTADAAGKWTYTLNPKTLKLALGSHTVTAVATSSEGIKSDPVTLATFTLKTPPVQTPIKPEKYNPFNVINYVAASLILVALFLLIEIRPRKGLKKEIL